MAKRYYGFAHFSKYIPVGSTALDMGVKPTNDENNFNIFAFITPENETVLVVVNEKEDTEISINGNFKNMKIIQSKQEFELKEIYNSVFQSKIKSEQNSILTIILK